ncbi:hypothetical protein [Bartonella sp. MU70NMGDW]|uniref:hypothetical protein n=1 Tax=Bartonella sp. MU70NMGDW TaxID=3243561 RepID=UPI0035D1136A
MMRVMFSFLGGERFAGNFLADMRSRYETGGGYEEKSLYVRNCGRFAKGKAVG